MRLPPLIPRAVLFGAPARLSPALSPCGRKICYLAPVDGVPHLWLHPLDGAAPRPLTSGASRFAWAHDGRHVVCLRDNDGDENTHVQAVDTRDGTVRDLTPYDGVQARLVGVSPRRPDTLLVGMNLRSRALHDVYAVSLTTGAAELVAENPGFAGWVHDRELAPRGAFRWTQDGGLAISVRDGAGWRPVHEVGPEDSNTARALGFSSGGTRLLLLSSRAAETTRLLGMDLATGETRVLHADPRYDVVGAQVSPVTDEPDLVVVHRERRHLEALDPALEPELARLRQSCRGDVMLLGRDERDRRWLVLDFVDDGPSGYHVYDRASGQTELLFTHQPALARYTLAPIEPFSFRARDGLDVHGYVTFPPGVPRRRLPVVLAVHGGPWSRDVWGSGGEAQWLANRGYLCVQVNFRGSTGYGKAFTNAGDREWGGRMQDDLVDAVAHLVGRGVADPAKVGIYGSSYGGYAALVGVTSTPEVFRCAVAASAPVNLLTFVRNAARTSAMMAARLLHRIGDPDADADLLWSRSPLSRIDALARPVLIAHGANDPRVRLDEPEQIVTALRDKGIPHEYLVFPDEGHGFAKPANRQAFYAATELFLARHLGGRCEPVARLRRTTPSVR
jgi:dipeptidyl aminopeptidase/acylaminoacyl peptidase